MNSVLKNTFQFISRKVYWQQILAVLFLLLAIFFFRSERRELATIIPNLKKADTVWLALGIPAIILCTLFQGGLYRKSFASINLSLKWRDAIALFLKRNFIGVFLPAGSITSLAYSPSEIRKSGFSKMQVHQASGLFAFASLLTVFIAGLPVIIFAVFSNGLFGNAWIGLIILFLTIAGLFLLARSIRQRGVLYKFLDAKLPAFTPFIDELFAANVNGRRFAGAVLYSLGVEISGMLYVYLAMYALGLPASFGVAAITYIVAVLMMVISPFLKGLGAVELAMVYALGQFGYSPADALSVTILFRLAEFWIPLAAGFFAFAWRGKELFLRLSPAILTFSLGLVNILSSVTPPIHQRLRLLHKYIPMEATTASHVLVLFIGISLLVTAAFLFRGLRNAWVIALTLSVFSLIGHLTKALDYEEAILAAVTVIILLMTASQYRIRSSNKWMQTGIKTALLSFLAVLLFGFISFYFIDVKHFGVDFSWRQSLRHTMNSFFLLQDSSLHPQTKFGHEFIALIRVLGIFTWSFLLFTFIKPNFNKHTVNASQVERAKFLLSQFGNSANDYFKIYKDKLFFFSDIHEAFLAYRISGGYAVVLESPVCEEENKLSVLAEFDHHCRKMGLIPAFYRVDESNIPWFNILRKQKILIGQEAILEIKNFSLSGKEKGSLRNGLNSLQKKGYRTSIERAPHTPEFIALLKNVSDEWLKSYEVKELVFSQGMFSEAELQHQDIITLQDENGEIKAFLNIIPDFADDECTYDLIRKTNDAPVAAMDGLIIELIQYAKEKGKLFLNLGMVPMSGLGNPENAAEQIIKMAADKIKRFQHYKGLREFKEKYASLWENKYLVYDNDFDLVRLPVVLNNIMKP